MAINARLSARLGHNPSACLLLENPTIDRLAGRLRRDPVPGGKRAHRTIPRLDEGSRGDAALSFAQEGIWFVDRLAPRAVAYNVPFTWRLVGPLDPERLRCALEQIVHRHEPLRTVFRLRGGIPHPVVASPRQFDVTFDELPASDPAQAVEPARRIEQEKSRPFDLANDTLVRALLLRLGPNDHVLVLTAHHVAFDGWSLNVLWRELRALYASALRSVSTSLPELPVRYAEFAAWQRVNANQERINASLQYWRDRLSGVAPSGAIGRPFQAGRAVVPLRVPCVLIGSRTLRADLRAGTARVSHDAPASHGWISDSDRLVQRTRRRCDRRPGRGADHARARGLDRLLHQHAGRPN